MTNEVATTNVFGGRVAAVDTKSLAQKAAASAQNNPRSGGADGADFLNFSGKIGKYTIGKDKREIDNDERWLVNVNSFQDGFICWKQSKPIATRLANIYDGVPVVQPNEDEGGPFDTMRGEGWHQAKAMVLKSLDSDDGQQGYFKINSVSGVAAIAELQGEFSRRAIAGEPAWPVVRLEIEEFTAQGYKNFKPVFAIEGWLDDEQMEQLAQDPDVDVSELLDLEPSEDEPEEAPAPTKAPARRRRG